MSGYVKQYEILEGRDKGHLDECVALYLAQGWQPQGGVAVFGWPNLEPVFYQAMVKIDFAQGDHIAMEIGEILQAVRNLER